MQHLDKLFREFFPNELLKYARHLSGCDHNSKDILQDAALRVLKSKIICNLPYNQQKYLSVRIVKNVFLSSIKKKKQLDFEIEVETPDKILIKKEDNLIFLSVLKLINTDKKGDIYTLYIDGYKQKDIAEKNKISIDVVRTSVFNVKKQLKVYKSIYGVK